jgi:hypothetical protein
MSMVSNAAAFKCGCCTQVLQLSNAAVIKCAAIGPWPTQDHSSLTAEEKHVPVVIFGLPAALRGSSDSALAVVRRLVIAIEFVFPKRVNSVKRILDALLPAVVATFNII